MPPILGDIIRTVKDYVSGASPEEECDENITSVTADSDPQSQTSTRRSMNSSAREAELYIGSGKRMTCDGMSERDERTVKRICQTGDHEKRLIGDHAPDIKRTSLSGRSDEFDSRRRAKMPQGANRRGFRSMNTLDLHPGGSSAEHRVPNSVDEHRRHIQSHEAEMLMNLSPAPKQMGKRRRMGSPFPSSPSQPIDLTTEEYESQSRPAVARMEIDSRPESKSSQCSQRSTASGSPPHHKQYFDNRAFRTTSSMTESRPTRSRTARPGDFEADVRLSLIRRTPPMKQHPQDQGMHDSQETSPFFSAGVEPSASPSTVSERRTRPPTGASIAQVYLPEGMPSKPPHIIRHEKKSPESSSKHQDKQYSKHHTSIPRRPSSTAEEELRQNKEEVRNFYANAPEPPESTIKSKFARIPRHAVSSRAKDRMLPMPDYSRNGQDRHRVSLESEDELSGATTVLSTVMPNAAKFGRAPEESPSSTALLPSPIQTMKPARGTHPTKASAKRSISNHDLIRNPVSSVSSQCCVVSGDNIELVWDHDLEAFKVECNGEIQMLPGEEQPFQIDKSAVTHKLYQCGATFQLYLKGSMSTFGNGKTLIWCKTIHAMSSIASCLTQVQTGKPTTEEVGPGKMQHFFRTQSLELSEAFEKLRGREKRAQVHRDIVGPSPVLKPGQQQSYRGVEDGEPISYESRNASNSPPLDHLSPSASYSKTMRSPVFAQDSHNPSGLLDDHRRSTRRLQRVRQPKPRTPTPDKWTRIHNPTPWYHPVTYPTAGPRRVTVDFQDLERLDEGECLNDNIVDFALRQIEEGMEPQHRRDVHFFNSFFFSALSTKNGRKDFNYDAVKRWTRTTDLFTIPYVVVPINAEFHWFIAIVCNLPALERKISGLDNETQEEKRLHITDASSDAPYNEVDGVVSPHNTSDAKRSLHDNQSESDPLQGSTGLNLPVTDSDHIIDVDTTPTPHQINRSIPFTNAKAAGRHKRKPIGRRYSPHDPVIMTLDSLGNTRSPEIRYLKQYIRAEAKDKRAMDVEVTQLLGITAKGVPEQSNFTDCGLYLIGYLEEFARDPRKFVGKILSREMEETEFENFNPSAKRSDIRDTLIELYKRQEIVRKAEKEKKRAAKRQAQPTDETCKATEPALSEPQREHTVDGRISASSETDGAPKVFTSVQEVTGSGNAHTSSQSNTTDRNRWATLPEAHMTDGLVKAGSDAPDAFGSSNDAIASTSPPTDTLDVASSQTPNHQATPKSENEAGAISPIRIMDESVR